MNTEPTLIVLNGASSAGKSTLAREIQRLSSSPVLHAQIDGFAGMLPPSMKWSCIKDIHDPLGRGIVHAYHSAVTAAVKSGYSVIADHVIGDDRNWMSDLANMSNGLRVVCVGVHCDLDPLLSRERARTDRKPHPQVAERQYHSIHEALSYDIEVDTSRTPACECAQKTLEKISLLTAPVAWKCIIEKICSEFRTEGQPISRVGCVQVYTGDGKGKTTAAVGLAVRAAGAGQRVFIGQFIKKEDSSEMAFLRQRCPAVSVEQFGLGRFITGDAPAADIEAAQRGIARLREVLTSGSYDMVIADEANGAAIAGVIDVEDILKLITARPDHVEFVITGRNAHNEVLERADLVTDMRCVKHCFAAGVPAREGIEF